MNRLTIKWDEKRIIRILITPTEFISQESHHPIQVQNYIIIFITLTQLQIHTYAPQIYTKEKTLIKMLLIKSAQESRT